MAYIKLEQTKDGRKYWRIGVSRGHGQSSFVRRFYWPTKANGDPVSEKTAVRERDKFIAAFEQSCASGEVLLRAEEKEKAAREAAKAAEEAAKAAEEAKKIKTFRQYGEQVFMPKKRVICAEKTRRYYQNALDNHLYPAFGDLPIQSITSAQINAFFLKLTESQLAHSTIVGIFVTCNQLFKEAFFDETIEDHNPMLRVERPRRRKGEQSQKVPEAFTAEELKTIFSLLDGEPTKWRAFVHLVTDTGIRRGEACALRWECINLKENSALIRENICYTPEKGIYIDTTKTGKERVVYFSQETSSILRQYRKEQIVATSRREARLIKDNQPLLLDKIAVPDYVFTERGNRNPMHPDSVNRYFQKFGKKHGIEIHCHKIRHSFASIAITKGADIASVAEVLGHADKSTTLRVYSHADEASKRRASGTVSAAIKEA